MAKMNEDSVIFKNCTLAFKLFREQIKLAKKWAYEEAQNTSVLDDPYDIWWCIHLQAKTIVTNAETFLRLTLRTTGAIDVEGLGEPIKNEGVDVEVYQSYRVTYKDTSQRVFHPDGWSSRKLI